VPCNTHKKGALINLLTRNSGNCSLGKPRSSLETIAHKGEVSPDSSPWVWWHWDQENSPHKFMGDGQLLRAQKVAVRGVGLQYRGVLSLVGTKWREFLHFLVIGK
jgi:hypothetical protein